MCIPLGTYKNAILRGVFAAGAAEAVADNKRLGNIASNNGKAIAVPIPRSSVLRLSDETLVELPDTLIRWSDISELLGSGMDDFLRWQQLDKQSHNCCS